MPPAVSVTDLAKRYGDVEAVRGVSFEVAAGEIFGILGPNGAGKTTTIECILGLRYPDSGSISVAGVDAVTEPKRARQMIGAQLQSTAMQDKITPREALALFGGFYDNAIKPNELLTRFSLNEKAHATFDTLSGGQRQRLALALAFVNNPAVLFLDEPTAGLDPQVRRELHREIRGIRDTGRTVVLTTHYIEEAHDLCDQIAIIDHGKILASGTPDGLMAASKALAIITVRAARSIEAGKLRGIAAVASVEPTADTWRIATTNVTQTLGGLVRAVESDSNELLDLQIHRPTLEDVFVELTGTSLREE